MLCPGRLGLGRGHALPWQARVGEGTCFALAGLTHSGYGNHAPEPSPSHAQLHGASERVAVNL